MVGRFPIGTASRFRSFTGCAQAAVPRVQPAGVG